QAVAIWIDAKHELSSMQYHPGAGWLKDHGYDPQMVKSVHIPRAQGFVDHIANHSQPWALLHELAHAYHDQFLGWNHAGIQAAHKALQDSNNYKSVLHISGRQREHYALTNPKEFFAEMSESFLGTNDFYPFVRGELREALPETYSLMQAIWMDE
ncbi:MAG: metallopeptidase, partial [Planctomicrobium sp.]|nr:metallopeptidase [Planctomicrobium sp.]